MKIRLRNSFETRNWLDLHHNRGHNWKLLTARNFRYWRNHLPFSRQMKKPNLGKCFCTILLLVRIMYVYIHTSQLRSWKLLFVDQKWIVVNYIGSNLGWLGQKVGRTNRNFFLQYNFQLQFTYTYIHDLALIYFRLILMFLDAHLNARSQQFWKIWTYIFCTEKRAAANG